MRTNVTLRQQPNGRLGQSVSHTPSEDIPDDVFDIPSLLEVPEDDEDDENMDDFGNALEEEFFGRTEHEHHVPEKKSSPVHICAHNSYSFQC
jgi:hypothetical protein